MPMIEMLTLLHLLPELRFVLRPSSWPCRRRRAGTDGDASRHNRSAKLSELPVGAQVCNHPDEVQALASERHVRLGEKAPMLRGRREVALEPRRVVVELEPERYAALERLSGRLGPGGLLRAVALGLAVRGKPAA